MPNEEPIFALRAMITAVGRHFLVSVYMLEQGKAPTFVVERILSSSSAIDAYLEQLAEEMGYPAGNIERCYKKPDGKT